MKLTKKMFREQLNKEFPAAKSYKNNQYTNRVRPYGDYLYSQDREMFNVNFEDWKKDINVKDARWSKIK